MMRGSLSRPATAFAAAARATTTTATTTALTTRRAFSATVRRSGDAHGPQYDPPTGWLFGVKPGEKYKKEGWEDIFFYGFYGSFACFAVALAFKPDTS